MRRRPLPPVREEVPNSKSWKSVCENEWIIYTLVACVGALTYANSLNGEFVHDDIPAIVSNRDVNSGNPVVQVFKNDFWGTPMSDPGSHKSYRPLTTLSFRLNYALFGFSPWWWHACNVALHAACCVLVARTGALVARLQRPFAALAALLFAVHPIHTEAVAGVVGRADVLACVFFLCSLLLYHGSTGRHRVWASILLAALSMLAKETGLTVLLFNIAFDLYRCWSPLSRISSAIKCRWRGDSMWGRVARVLAALAVLVSVRLALLQGSLPSFSPQDNPPAFHSSFIVRLMTFCYLAAFNWWLLLCPWWLSHDWQMGSIPLVTGAWDPRNLLTCAAIFTLVTLSYRCLIDLELQRHSPVVVGLMLLVIPYLPASNLLVTVGFVVAERVLYIPSVGSVILTAYGVELLWRRANSRWVLFLAAASLVASGVARTHLRNRDWRTRETLLRADLAVLPHNAKLHYNFANFLKDVEQQESAVKHYKEALKLWPSYASAHNNLGTLVTGWSRAEHHFLQALKYNRDHVNAHYNLAKLYRKKNRNTESLKMLERCISLEPRFVQAYLEILNLTEEDEKRAILDKLVELEPSNWEHYLLYGNWMKDRGLLPLALQYYTTAMRLSFSGDTQNHERGKVLSTRAACLAYRSNGQTARVLQMLTRWQAARCGSQPQSARRRAARAWRLRTELAGRAALYARPHAAHTQTTSTCLHHSKLEVSPGSYVNGKHLVKADTRTLLNKNNVRRDIDAILSRDDKNHCQNKDLKKSISISAQYKPTHNKSDTGHKQKSCPLHKKKKIKQPETFTPFVSDHLIQTY
ncbi:protein O-mannosyl-transferase TMTC1-like [Plodia interpunctella]|uniref:protein O-mannosyl-transferase TMTC1-like n=1 Tax=Plodia interpunctella TaxID=58824 RepID=UPI0023687F42|nr:protein O-mannosyl-transferase TMTC1-like [Plodia interpunctella]XP_053599808.1 protein O-mannosyl-transferase TMTC1-like [Plodia interpunctella]